jgi:hypothetical protein
MGKPDAPTPPDPIATARAQTGTNVSTAVANAYLGNVNQVTPTGTLDYNQSNSYQWTDPTTGSTYNIPTFTATQTLTPQGQAIQNQTLAAQYNLAGMANAQSARISGLLSNNLDLSGAPSGGNAQNILNVPQAVTSYNQGGPIQSSIAGGGPIQMNVGPQDFSTDRQAVQDALMARMNPQLQIEQQRLQQQLADQGIRYGSQAYSDAMLQYSQQANDARYGAIQQAGQEQQRMQQELLAQGQFANAAQQQQYQQNLGQGQFANAAQGQLYTQNAAAAQFENAGLAQQLQQQQSGFNAEQAALNQYLQEQFAIRNQPINEISSLLSGSQVSQPNFIGTNAAQIPTTDVAGLVNQSFNQQLGIYQQQNQNYQSLAGGILGLGAGVLKSDERVKENITRMGTVFSATDEDDEPAAQLPIYQYSYKDDPASVMHIGPMAQDVEKIDKGAVKTIGGIKHIYPQRVMGNILRAA